MTPALSPLLLLLALGSPARADDYFTPFPDAKLEDRKVKEFDEYEFPVGALARGRHVKFESLEGRLTTMSYDNPAERSTLELMRNYESSLKKTGFTSVYSCKGAECGEGCIQDKALGWHCAGPEARYAAFTMGSAYLGVLVTEEKTRVVVLEKKGMDDRSGAASTPAMATPEAAPAPAPAPAGPGAKAAADEVETGVIKGLNTFGFQAKAGSADGSSADIIVEGKFATAALDASGDKRWKWARSTLTLSLKDGHSGKTFLRFDATDRQASADYKEAARRSRVELGKKASEQVQAAISDYFENQ